MPWKTAPPNDPKPLAKQAREEGDKLGGHPGLSAEEIANTRASLHKLAADLESIEGN